MASGFSRVSCNGDGWTLLAQNCDNAIVQLEGNGPALIRVASSDPGAGATTGMILSRSEDGITILPILGMDKGTDIVYGRMKIDETENILALSIDGGVI